MGSAKLAPLANKGVMDSAFDLLARRCDHEDTAEALGLGPYFRMLRPP